MKGFTQLGCRDIEIRKFKCVAYAQFLCLLQKYYNFKFDCSNNQCLYMSGYRYHKCQCRPHKAFFPIFTPSN